MNLLNFLKYYVRLKEENAEIFEYKLSNLTGKTYLVGIEQFLLHRERKEGIEEGIEFGFKKGIEQGIVQDVEQDIRLHIYIKSYFAR